MVKNRNIYGILMALLITSCMGLNETDPAAYLKPELEKVIVSEDYTLYITLSSYADSPDKVKSCGFYLGRNMDMSGAERIESAMESIRFSAEVLLKDYDSDYYVCSFISNGEDELMSESEKITIGPLTDYVSFEGIDVDSYVSSTQKAEVSVQFILANGVDATSYGICYGETRNLSVEGDYESADNTGDGYFTASIPSLVAGKQYYARPFIKDGDDIAYAEVYSLNVYAVPEVITSEVKKVTDNSAHIYGEVIDDCGKEILERGFVLEKGDANPTVNSMKFPVSGKKGTFDLNVTDLDPNTYYSVRAYARNSEGTAYGKVLNFTTNVAMPSVETKKIVNITSESAGVECVISDDGGDTVSECGVLLSTSSDMNPDKAKKVSAVTSSSSSFMVSLTDLNRKTKYYVQAYVTNSAGTSYGNVLDFETLAELPTVSTSTVSDITDVGAKSGGDITDDGGDKITARGVVWGKTQTPTVENDPKSYDGTGTGKFDSEITGLRYETVYYVRAYATNSVGTAYGEALKFTTGSLDINNVTDLAAAGTANCYIVSESGVYTFPAVKGNSSESVGSVASVEVLWETFGTSVTPNVGDLVDYATYSDGSIIFNVPQEFREGNAVIAAKNSSGTILWSWHIWLTDKPEEQVYYNNAGTMMDRNLGATSATPGDVGALGLLYQWGRKDPFLGSSSISDGYYKAKSTGTWPSPATASMSKGTVDYAIKNPMTFIEGTTSSNYDWHCSSRNNDLWKPSKTIYDPCPAGWRVPDGGDYGVWSKACGSSSPGGLDDNPYDSINKGMNFSSKFGSSSVIWYPASGYADNNFSTPLIVGTAGSCWSVTPNNDQAYSLDFSIVTFFPSNGGSRSYERSVRCLKISEIEGDTEGFGGSDYEW